MFPMVTSVWEVKETRGSTARLRKLLILLKSQKHLMIAKNVITVIPMRAYERDFRVDSGR